MADVNSYNATTPIHIRFLIRRMTAANKRIVHENGLERLINEVKEKLKTPVGKHLWTIIDQNFQQLKDRMDNYAWNALYVGNVYEYYIVAARYHSFIKLVYGIWKDIDDGPTTAFHEENLLVLVFIGSINVQARNILNIIYPDNKDHTGPILNLRDYVGAV